MEAQKRGASLRRLADDRNITVAAMIDLELREHGSIEKAAESLGVKPINLYQWLRRNNYRLERLSRIVRAS